MVQGASDQAKPNGILRIVPSQEPAFWRRWGTCARSPGVGKVTESHLHACGIRQSRRIGISTRRFWRSASEWAWRGRKVERHGRRCCVRCEVGEAEARNRSATSKRVRDTSDTAAEIQSWCDCRKWWRGACANHGLGHGHCRSKLRSPIFGPSPVAHPGSRVAESTQELAAAPASCFTRPGP